MVGGVYGGKQCWENGNLLGRRVAGLERMVAEEIEDVTMAEVLRQWKQRKELVF